uniref:YEATS domain-containing protein n=1 Tax=Crocodylus porosus TaxID=8502 RepID=A0A7M4DVD6_CROPO
MCAIRAQVRKKPTVEGFTHNWMVFVRGPEHSNIQHFVEKVVFHLHESFPQPKRGRSTWTWLRSSNPIALFYPGRVTSQLHVLGEP